MNETARKFGYPDSVVHEFDHWLVQLRPAQVTIGSLVLVCKDDASRFGEIGYSEFRKDLCVPRSIHMCAAQASCTFPAPILARSTPAPPSDSKIAVRRVSFVEQLEKNYVAAVVG